MPHKLLASLVAGRLLGASVLESEICMDWPLSSTPGCFLPKALLAPLQHVFYSTGQTQGIKYRYSFQSQLKTTLGKHY